MNTLDRKCKECGSDFRARRKSSPQRFCSKKCSQKDTNKKISDALRGKKKSDIAKLHMSLSKKGKTWTEAQRNSIVPNLPRGESHPGWKGDRVGYEGIHIWLSNVSTKNGMCTCCGLSGYTEWALKEGREYKRDSNFYEELCIKCHRSRDSKGPSRKKIFLMKLQERNAH